MTAQTDALARFAQLPRDLVERSGQPDWPQGATVIEFRAWLLAAQRPVTALPIEKPGRA